MLKAFSGGQIINGYMLSTDGRHIPFFDDRGVRMRYLVISDLHGDAAAITKALSYFDKYNCDQLVTLGDILNHGPRNPIPDQYSPPKAIELLNAYKDRVIAVRGNCDAEVESMQLSYPCNAPYAFILVPDPNAKAGEKVKHQRIMLTHGHLYKIDHEEMEKAVSMRDKLGLQEGDIVFSGHTHVAGFFEKKNGLINANPGSTTLPKGGTQAGFGLILEDRIELRALHTDELVATHMLRFI